VLEAAGNEPNLPSRLEQAYFGHDSAPAPPPGGGRKDAPPA
jgi:hypothetical protein